MKFVVGVDESDLAERVLTRGLELAEKLGADVDVVYVSHVPATVLAAMSGVPMSIDSIVEAQRRGVWDRLEGLISGSSAAVSKIDLSGYPADAIIEYASDTDADVVVVGSRGRGPVASMLLGSTSSRIVNHAPCDVFVVRRISEGGS